MKLAIIAIIAFSGILLGSQNKKHNDNIKIYTDIYPPDVMFAEKDLSGLSVDILDSLLKKINSSQSKDDIALTSWARAYNIGQSKKNTMIFPTLRTNSRESLFKWVGPLSASTPAMIALKSKNIKIKKISDANKYKVGALKKGMGHLILINNGVDTSSIKFLRGSIIKNAFTKMEKNKIDMLSFYSMEAAFYTAKTLGFDVNKYEVIYKHKKSWAYFSFNKNTDDKIIKKWQKGLDKLKKDGSFDKILKKYLIEK